MNKLKTALILLMLIPVVFVYAGYYDSVIGLTGEQLKLALRNLISTNTNSSYDGSREEMFGYIDNVNGQVRCVYTGKWFAVTPGTIPNANVINTEHTYAQSWFSSTSSSIKKADLHHLYPTTNAVNSARGNYPFFTVPNHASADVYYNNTPWQSYRGSDGMGHTVFEPADQHKGNVARSLLYFTVRYNDGLIQGGVNMLPILLQWHVSDPVDVTESTRNQEIFDFQHNRNPFVDHPEFVAAIWGPTSNEDPTASPVPDFTLGAVYPNPFSTKASVSVESRGNEDLSVKIFNLKGQLVREEGLAAKAGNQEFVWDGRDANGSELSGGIYIIRISSDACTRIAKVVKG